MKNYKKKFIMVVNGFSIFSLEKQKICGSGVVAKTVGFKGKAREGLRPVEGVFIKFLIAFLIDLTK